MKTLVEAANYFLENDENDIYSYFNDTTDTFNFDNGYSLHSSEIYDGDDNIEYRELKISKDGKRIDIESINNYPELKKLLDDADQKTEEYWSGKVYFKNEDDQETFLDKVRRLPK